jgi:EAL domain-containing protein (putative c-di-GMP-specific phosphodiesterase class I)
VGANFLNALGRKLRLRLAAFVTDTSPARVLWSLSTESANEFGHLEQRGREWLTANTVGGGRSFENDEFAVSPVCARDGEILGVVVAAKPGGASWTSEERALVGFAAEFYGPSLDARAAPLQAGPAQFPAGPNDAATDLETGMRTAAGNGELYLVYQPEVDLHTGQIVAVEALLRWLHPRHGALEPESFISLAEQSDLIKVLGAWVIEESLGDLATWNLEVLGLDVSLRVNVSPVQIAIDDIVALIADALKANGLAGERVCVEITENVMPSDVAQLSTVLRELKELGVSSAIDDLATGYSTLSRLRSLLVDIVKIDRSLASTAICGPGPSSGRSSVWPVISMSASWPKESRTPERPRPSSNSAAPGRRDTISVDR